MGLAAGSRSHHEPGLRSRSPSRTAAARRQNAVQRAEYADLKVYHAERSARQSRSHEHGARPRGPLSAARSAGRRARVPHSGVEKAARPQGKALLRALARRRLPGKLWQLPKRGFTAPIGDWIAGPHAAQFREEVLDRRTVLAQQIDVNELDRRFVDHQAGRRDHGYTLWSAWVLERWLEGTRGQGRHPSDATRTADRGGSKGDTQYQKAVS